MFHLPDQIVLLLKQFGETFERGIPELSMPVKIVERPEATMEERHNTAPEISREAHRNAAFPVELISLKPPADHKPPPSAGFVYRENSGPRLVGVAPIQGEPCGLMQRCYHRRTADLRHP